MMLFLFFYGSYYYVHVNVSQDSRQFFQFGLIYDLYLFSWKLSFTFVQVSRRQRDRISSDTKRTRHRNRRDNNFYELPPGE